MKSYPKAVISWFHLYEILGQDKLIYEKKLCPAVTEDGDLLGRDTRKLSEVIKSYDAVVKNHRMPEI